MNKSKATGYTAEQGEHYKMYKQGKIWAFALISTIAIGAGTLAVGHESVSADTSSASVTATANTSAATSGDTTQLGAAATSSAASTTDAASSAADSTTTSSATSTSNDSAASSTATSTSTTAVSVASTTSSAASSSALSATSTSVTSSVASSAATSATSSVASQTLVDPTSAVLSAAQSSAAARYAATNQPQQVNAVAAATDTTSNAVLKLSSTAVGYGSGQKTLTVSLVITNPKAGDVYTITIPADTYVLKYSTAATGTGFSTPTVATNTDGTKTVTYTVTANQTGVVTPYITYNLMNNYGAQDKPMTTIGTVTRTVTYTVNGVEQTPVTFTQTIQPYADMTGISLTNPTGSATTALQSGTEYVFSYTVNEANGVMDNDYLAGRVNSADNYGTTLTIAVPAGFELNAVDTAQLNAFTDATTITQPGGAGTDIIITVPMGSGNQNWQPTLGQLPYYLAGTFTQAATDEDATYTATTAATMNQTVDAAGTVYTATGAAPWSVIIAGTTSDVTATGTAKASGNSTTGKTQLSLDADTTNDPSYLAQFTFANTSTTNQKDVQLELDIPDGVVATGIVVPKGEVTSSNYLPDDLSYTYTLTLADGTTETGAAVGGDIITSSTGVAIRKAVIVVNELAAGAALTTTGDLTTTNTLSVLGTLNATLDDGTDVQTGDVMTFGMVLTFAGETDPAATATINETVAQPYAAVYNYVLQNNQDPGATNAGTMAIMNPGNWAHTTDYIYEPIFYYVIPSATTFVSATNVDSSATVSEFTADDGRTVVKIDYTGTGLSVQTDTGQVQINLANKADALPGSYTFAMYIYSPTTLLANTTKVTDTSYTEGNADAVSLLQGQSISTWNIQAAGVFTDYTFAQGTQDTDPVAAGTSNAYSTDDSHFYVSLVNTANDGQDHDGTVIVNLPTEGDSEGSGFTFALSGPITVPANYTTAAGTGTTLDATVLYSTTRASVINNQSSVDTSSYMTADQLEAAGIAWSEVRSVLISITNIASATSTGRIDLAGTAIDGADHTGTTGYLETAFSIDGGAYSVTGKADGASSLALLSYSTITARYHYVDVNGNDQYIDIPDLSQTLQNGIDSVAVLPTSLDELSTVDQNLIPDGYELVGSYTVLAADGSAGQATSGAVASRDFDGDIIQYELQGKYAVTFNIVDDTTGTTTVAKTVRGASGQEATFDVDVPTGYVLSPTQEDGVTVTNGAVNYTLTAADQQVVNVHITKVDSLTDDLQYSLSEVTDAGTVLNTSEGTSSAQITYVLADKDDSDTATTITATTGPMTALTQSITAGYTLVGIKATINGQTVSADVGTDAYNALVQQLALTATADGAGFDAQVYYDQYFGTTFSLAADPNVQIQLIVSADPQTVNVVYKDADNNNQQVGDAVPVIGATGATYDWTAAAPAGYKLASGQEATGSYTYTTDAKQQIIIYLAHEHALTTESRTYTVTYTGAPADKMPATSTQAVTWNEDVDAVTGAKTWTPQSKPATVTVTPIAGYTASDAAVAFVVTSLNGEDPVDESKVVTYTAQPQSTNIQYVDDDNNGAQVGDLVPLTGTTDATVAWTADVPTNYQLATDQAASGSYTFAASDNTPVVIHLTHKHASTTKTVDYTVNYQGVADNANPADGQAQIIWTGDTDETTGVTAWTSSRQSATVNSPAVTGYTADQAAVTFTVPATSTTEPTAQTATVNYAADAQTTSLSYVDDVTGATVGTATTLTGTTSGTTNWTVTVPAGYALADGQAASGSYTFAASDNTPVVVHLTHAVSHGTVTTSRTITYVVAGDTATAPVAVTQTVDWLTSTDLVTGQTVATPQGNFASVTSPTIATTDSDGVEMGWQPDLASIDGIQLAAQTGTPANPDDVTVTYQTTKNQVGPATSADQYTVNFVTSSGEVVGTTQLVGNAGNQFGVSAPAGYHFVDADAGTGTLPESNAAAVTILVAADTTNNNGTTTPGGDDNGGTTTPHQLPSTGGSTTTTGNGTQSGGGTATDAVPASQTAARTLPSTGSTSRSLPATGSRSLPQTGDQQNVWAVLGVGLLTATLGLFGIKRRRDTER